MYYDKQQIEDAQTTAYICIEYLFQAFYKQTDPDALWYCKSSVVGNVVRLYNRANNVKCGKDQYDGDINRVPEFLAIMGVYCVD